MIHRLVLRSWSLRNGPCFDSVGGVMARELLIESTGRVDNYWTLVFYTAQYRFSKSWEGARKLMAARGYDPAETYLISHTPGDDYGGAFVLPDRMAVEIEFSEDARTGQAIRINGMAPFEGEGLGDDEFALANEIQRNAALRDAFNRAVSAYRDFHFQL
jgi:hypothetical protein